MTIPRLKDVRREWKKTHKDLAAQTEYKSDKKQDRAALYGSEQWRNLSKAHRMEHPLCELSAMEGQVRLAECVHHLVSPFSQNDESLRMLLLLDDDNIISLCQEIHGYVHANMDMLTDRQKQWLKEKTDRICDKYCGMGYYGLDTTTQYRRKDGANNK